jgi:hypothetical protein
MADHRLRYADAPCCTTRRRNAHRTEEHEVLYRWHPWAGRHVHVQEIIQKGSGAIARCQCSDDPSGRCLELPVWMFDRAACATMRIAPAPQVGFTAILALVALLTDARSDRSAESPSSSTPRTVSADWISHDGNRGDAHATSEEFPSRLPLQTNPVRPVRSTGRSRSGTHPGMTDAATGDAPDAHRPDRAPDPRPRSRRSSCRTGRGARR